MDNRELAALILLGATVLGVAILAARKPDLRASLKGVGASMIAPAILIPTALLAAWIFGLIVAAKSLGLWDDNLLFGAIFWSGATGLILFFQVGTRKGDEPFLRPALRHALAVGVFIEIVASFFVFDIWVELLLAPVATLLLLLSLIAGQDGEYASAKNLVDGLLGFIGIAMALAWVVQFISGINEFDWGHAERQLGMPVWLTLGLLPFLYLVALWTGYDHAFRQIRIKSGDRQVPLHVKLGFMLAIHGQAAKANAISAPAAYELARADGLRSAWRASRAFLQAEERRVVEVQEAADRLDRYVGVDGVDDHGRRLDQREFKETKAALQWLATAHMGWYDRKNRYKDDLLDILTFDALPEDHGITMDISDDGQRWFAWRRTVTGWCLAIGAASRPPDQWLYDGADSPVNFPGVGKEWGDSFGIEAENW
jgi:hypothetical protein